MNSLNNITKNKSHNLGLEILRLILSFWVVIVHCGRIKNPLLHKILFKRIFHVPTFMLMSFYFFYKILYQININKIIQRFQRLLFPYILWPLIILILNNLLLFLFGISQFNRKLLLKDFIIQILYGRIYHGVFWYHFTLIFLTLFFTICNLAFKNIFIIIIQIIAIFSYILQYNNINYYYFIQFKVYISNSLGLIIEMAPIAITGLIFGYINIIKELKKYEVRIFFFSLITIFILFKYDIFINIKGFIYPGIIFNLGAIFLFLLFSYIPIDKIDNKKFICFIGFLTNYTGGIYYMHLIVRDYLLKKILFIRNRTIYGCLIIYLICYLISFFGFKLFSKTKFKYLFY